MISIFSLLLIFSFSIQASDVIQFPDSDLKVALLRQLGKSPNDEISIAEAENAPQTLDLSQAGISNSEGIQYFKNVTFLKLHENNIQDLTPLSNLTKLKILLLNDNVIEDIAPLANLKNVTLLNLNNNQLTNLQMLKNIPHMHYLYIPHNKVNDITPLDHFKELDFFDYSFNQISDISSINNLTELCYGDINSQAIYLPSQTIKKGESVVVTNPIKAEDGIVKDIVVNGGSYDESTNQIIWENITTNQTLSYQFTKTIDYPKYGGMIEFSGTVFVDVVILGEPPILSGVDDLTIPFGEEFNPLQGVQAYDAEDGDITDQIIVEGKVDIFTSGTYELVYQVTDSENQTTTATRIITVELPASSINQIPTIEVNDRIVKKGTNFDPLEGVQAYDVEDGDITNQIKVIHNNVNTNHVGTYQVIYEVMDSQGAKATRLITVQVRDIPQTGLSLFN